MSLDVHHVTILLAGQEEVHQLVIAGPIQAPEVGRDGTHIQQVAGPDPDPLHHEVGVGTRGHGDLDRSDGRHLQWTPPVLLEIAKVGVFLDRVSTELVGPGLGRRVTFRDHLVCTLEAGRAVVLEIGTDHDVRVGKLRLDVAAHHDVHHLAGDADHRPQLLARLERLPHVHRDDDVGPHRACQVHRQVANETAVDQETSLDLDRGDPARPFRRSRCPSPRL